MKNAGRIAGWLLVPLLTAGAFTIGLRLGPNRLSGQNLYNPRYSLMEASSNGPIVLASYSNNSVKSHKVIRQAQDDEDIFADGPGATFQQVYILLKHNYVDGVPTDAVMGHGATATMLASLMDPESRFMTAPEIQELQAESKGIYRGAGIVTTIKTLVHGDVNDTKNPGYKEYRLTVVDPIPGSPADKAGIKPGDVVTEINNRWIATYEPVAANAKALKAAQDDPVEFNKIVTAIQKKAETALSLAQAEAKMMGIDIPDLANNKKPAEKTTDKTITLTVERPGVAKPMSISMPLDQVTETQSIVAKSLPNGVGMIKITSFTDETPHQFDQAVNNFGNDVKGIVVDLRNTPGGQLNAAAEVAGKLTGAKSLCIVQLKGKKEHDVPTKANRTITCPVVVLVNGGTANTAEMLASLLHDQGFKTVGEKTFGHAMDIAPVALRDGSGFTMTIGQFFTNSHSQVNGIGLIPDYKVESSATGDEQLNQAISVLSGRVANVPTPRG